MDIEVEVKAIKNIFRIADILIWCKGSVIIDKKKLFAKKIYENVYFFPLH